MRPSPRAPDTVNFNPRSREGSDPQPQGAPGPGVYFNPRSREGSDERWINRIRELEQFQSTLP